MESTESESPFRIFTYRSRKRTVRFLVSPSVVERIPFVEEVLMRAAAGGGESDKLIWPKSVVISGDNERVPVPADCLSMVFPNWLFERVKEQQRDGLPLYLRIGGYVMNSELDWGFSWVIGHYLKPLQTDEKLRRDCHILINVGLFFPIAYRPVGTVVRCLILLPFLLALVGIVYGGRAVFRSSKKFLYAKASIDRNLGRRNALAKTRQRLLELGEPPEKVKNLELPPDLKIVERDNEKVDPE